jgi:hypothetical protein
MMPLSEETGVMKVSVAKTILIAKNFTEMINEAMEEVLPFLGRIYCWNL